MTNLSNVALSHHTHGARARVAFLAPWLLISAPLARPCALDPQPQRQQGARAAVDPPIEISRRSCGLSSFEGGLGGGGADYKVHFGPSGMLFTPALGRDAPKNLPLRFTLLAAGRRGALVRDGAAATLRGEGLTARYERNGFVERYEVRPDGVEQSLVFAQLPPGTGDLVVEGRIETELPLESATAGEVRFVAPGIGGVSLGAVTGVDAAGRTARGALHYAAGRLELSLPEAFVRDAALPLVLDPLIGSIAGLSSASNDFDPAVAYDSLSARYLVVWQRVYSSGDADIVGQLVNFSGSLAGSAILVTPDPSGLAYAFHPRVASIRLRRAFVVVFSENPGSLVVAASVNASSGSVPSRDVLGTGGYADVSGESTSTDDEAIAVWNQSGAIRAAEVTVDAGLLLSHGTAVAISSPGSGESDYLPATARSGGPAGRYLVAWQRGGSVRNIWAAVVDANLNVIASQFQVGSNAGSNVEWPGVDGDGANWIVAYTQWPGSSASSVVCRRVTYDAAGQSGYATGEVVLESEGGAGYFQMGSAAWLGESSLVGYSNMVPSSGSDVRVRSLETIFCQPCEGLSVVDSVSSVTAFVSDVRVASQRSTTYGDEALVVWGKSNPGGEIKAQVYQGADGYSYPYAGGCGTRGSPLATCSTIAHAAMGLGVTQAPPSAPTWLMLAGDMASFACGPCVVVPNPFRGFVLGVGSTDARGETTVAIPFPPAANLSGVDLYVQWLTAASPGACAFGFDLSDAQKVGIR